MISRLLRNRRTTATRLNSPIRTAAKLLAVAACLTGTQATAQTPTRAGEAPVGSNKKLLYMEDSSRLKMATLESEPVFFERLEKQSKIESARLLANDAIQSLERVRRHLSVLSVDLLELANQELDRGVEPVEAAARNIVAAETELRAYHQGATAEAVAIASGRVRAASLLARIRRLIQVAERQLNASLINLNEGQKRLEDAIPELESSRDNAEGDVREDLESARQSIEKAQATLTQAGDQTKALVSQLVTIRRTYFPECPPTASQMNLTPTQRDLTPDTPYSARELEHASLTLLNASAPAIGLLEEAVTQVVQLQDTLGRARDLRTQTLHLVDRADTKENALYGKVRELQQVARGVLEQADAQLNEMKRLLTEDSAGETRLCTDCGVVVMQTRRIPDPSAACVHANQAMLRAERTLTDARQLAEQMNELLASVEMPESPRAADRLDRAQRELSGEKGVLELIALALERGREFRDQEFDFYPGDALPPAAEQVPRRNFEPMYAFYAARQNWHYPLYFEDLALERYGHTFGCVQPVVSYGKFIVDLAMVPYNVWLDHPHECQYTHGLYRPGDCVPHLIYLPRPDLHAALFQAAVWTGLLYMP